MKNDGGFTLIELMIVMCVVFMLIAFILPIIQDVNEQPPMFQPTPSVNQYTGPGEH